MLSLLLALAVTTSVSATPASTYPHIRDGQTNAKTTFAPVHFAENAQSIANNYIVVLKPETPLDVLQAHASFIHANAERSFLANPERFGNLTTADSQVGLKHLYTSVLKGYSGHFDDDTLGLIRAAPEVEYVEADQTVWASKVQNDAPWGLARISHRERLRLSTFKKYEYDPEGGEGVDVYVIDTGINVKHVSFEGRASWGKTVPLNDADEDGNGHGTHCAGTIASKDYGVSKKAHVIAVKVLRSNGSGSMSDVISGVEFAALAAQQKAKAARAEELRSGVRSNHKGSVANLSLGGGKSNALDEAINAAVDSGLHVAVAAGNDNKDACKYSPAAAANAVTVGASTLQDTRAYFSNWGTCVDVFAPGLNILSTWNSGDHSTNTISGTSMASPHTAGLLAYLLSLHPTKGFYESSDSSFSLDSVLTLNTASASTSNPIFSILRTFFPFFSKASNEEVSIQAPIPSPVSPKVLKRALLLLASPGKITDVGEGSPNLLIFNNFTQSAKMMENVWKRAALDDAWPDLE